MVPRCPPVPSRPGAARRPDGQPRLGAIRRPRLPLPMRWFGGRGALLLGPVGGLGSGLAGWAPAAATGASGGDAGAPAMVAAGMPTPAVPALTGDRTSAHDLRRWWKGSGDLDGVWSHLLLLVAVLPPLLPVSLWKLFAFDWINLIGPGEMAVLVGSRLVTALLQALLIDLLIDLLEEAIGQLLPVRRHADASGQIQIRHRKGSGQLLTLARTAGGGSPPSRCWLQPLAGWPDQARRSLRNRLPVRRHPGPDPLAGHAFGSPGGGRKHAALDSHLPGGLLSAGQPSLPLRPALSLGQADLQPTAVAERLEPVRRVLAGHPELGDAKVRLESADAGWRITLSGPRPVEFGAAEVQAARERLMLELLPLDSLAASAADCGSS